MTYLYTLQKDALDALVMEHDDEIGNPSFKKEISYLLQNQSDLISEQDFTRISSRYTLHSPMIWQSFQEQLKYKHANRTADYLDRVQQFNTKFQNFKFNAKI